MKRLRSSDSMCGLISNSTDHEQSPRGYGSNFQTMLDNYNDEEEDDATIVEEYSGNNNLHHHHMGGGLSEKKRRLRTDQVKALEKNFELENKLEPERKTKLAQELGLQPRQVAVWFQNRRARWKTKQLEKDYGVLKNQYDSLRHNFDSLRRDNESLLQEITKLKAKINGEEEDNNKVTPESEISGAVVKEEEISLPESLSPIPSSPPQFLEHSTGFNYRRSFTDLRDLIPNSAGGSSDSCDSSVIESSSDNRRLTRPPPPKTTTTVTGGSFLQFVKMEQNEDPDDFLSGEEACGGFFSDEQPPSLHWYSAAADPWT